MAKEKMVFFRTSLGGFNKEDVNNYIEKLNADIADRERMSKKKLDAAESKYAEMEAKYKELEKKLERISELEAEADSREKLIGEYIEKVEAQAAEIENLRSSNESAESEKSELNAMLDSLSDAINKSEKYDDISSQIGEIILSARCAAEEIVNKANKEADSKRAQADAQMEGAAASFNARAATATYAIKSHIKKLANETYATLAEKTTQTSDMLLELITHISEVSKELEDKLANGKSVSESAVDAEVAKIFNDEHRLSLKK